MTFKDELIKLGVKDKNFDVLMNYRLDAHRALAVLNHISYTQTEVDEIPSVGSCVVHLNAYILSLEETIINLIKRLPVPEETSWLKPGEQVEIYHWDGAGSGFRRKMFYSYGYATGKSKALPSGKTEWEIDWRDGETPAFYWHEDNIEKMREEEKVTLNVFGNIFPFSVGDEVWVLDAASIPEWGTVVSIDAPYLAVDYGDGETITHHVSEVWKCEEESEE